MPKHLLPQITNRFSTYYYDLLLVDVDVREELCRTSSSEQQQQQKGTSFMFIWNSSKGCFIFASLVK
jgi:hypothetical protein